jgi:hypothetical protein
MVGNKDREGWSIPLVRGGIPSDLVSQVVRAEAEGWEDLAGVMEAYVEEERLVNRISTSYCPQVKTGPTCDSLEEGAD